MITRTKKIAKGPFPRDAICVSGSDFWVVRLIGVAPKKWWRKNAYFAEWQVNYRLNGKIRSTEQTKGIIRASKLAEVQGEYKQSLARAEEETT